MTSTVEQRVAQAVRALEHQAEVCKQPGARPVASTRWFNIAARDLASGKPPSSDYWRLFGVFHGLLALPERAEYADLILEVLRLMGLHREGASHRGTFSAMTMRVFQEFLTADDSWMVEPLLEALEKARHAPVGAFIGPLVISTLGLIGDARVVAHLRTMLQQPTTLQTPTDALSVGPLGKPLFATPGADRQVAALALAELAAAEAIPELVQMLQTERSTAAAVALGKLGARQAVELLVALLATIEPAAAQDDDDDFDDYDAYEDEVEERPSFAGIAEALGRLGDTRAVEPLARFLDDPTRGVEAAIALSRLGDPRGQPRLLATDERHGSWNASMRLMELGDPRGLERAAAAYSARKNANERANVVADLGRNGEPWVVPLLKWVCAHDRSTTSNGQSLADSAAWAIERIQVRQRHGRR